MEDNEQSKISIKIVPTTTTETTSNSDNMEVNYLTLDDFDIPTNEEEDVDVDEHSDNYVYDYENINPNNSIKNLMMTLKNKEMKQPTIDSYFTPYSVSKNYVTTDYEFENTLLKIEIKDLKEKMTELELLVLNMKTSAPNTSSSSSTSNSDDNNQSVQSPFSFIYDRMMTKIKNIESELSTMKLNFESYEATQTNHEDRIDMIEEMIMNNEEDDDNNTTNNFDENDENDYNDFI